MVLELSLPRLLAPAFGNTLFCWTAAIGLVLASLAAGYHVGGELSSRKFGSNPVSLWRIAALSALFVIISGTLGDRIVGKISALGMIMGPLAGTCLLAVPSAGVGAAVLPISVSLTSRKADSGKRVGRLYAFSTIGSVVGVLVTGYLLLPVLGVAGSLITAAALVFVTFILGNMFALGSLGLGCVIAALLLVPSVRDQNVLLDKSNGYHRIKVVSNSNDSRIRLLYLDSSLEGAVMLGSKNPGLPYQRDGALLAGGIPGLRRCFFLGGGSFSIPGYIHFIRPDVQIDVAEIDRDVVVAAENFLALPSGLNIMLGDARRTLVQTAGRYDLIMNDAFHGVRNVPFHLVTREFHRLIASKLTAKGIYAVNVMGHLEKSLLVNSMIRTLKQDFRYVNRTKTAKNKIDNLWLVASNSPLHTGQPADYTSNAIVFTDDHAPVEYLVALDLAEETLVAPY